MQQHTFVDRIGNWEYIKAAGMGLVFFFFPKIYGITGVPLWGSKVLVWSLCNKVNVLRLGTFFLSFFLYLILLFILFCLSYF